MSKPLDLAGRKFGDLIAIKRIKSKDGRHRRWMCKCSCGKITKPLVINLTKGRTKSCGCKRRTNLTGKKVGRLTAIKPTKIRVGSCVKWLCKCDCGNFTKVNSHALTSSQTLSCGCINSPNLSGKIFGKLTVIKKGKNIKGQQFWICKCECGYFTKTTTGRLNFGTSISCGVACPIKIRLAPLRVFY